MLSQRPPQTEEYPSCKSASFLRRHSSGVPADSWKLTTPDGLSRQFIAVPVTGIDSYITDQAAQQLNNKMRSYIPDKTNSNNSLTIFHEALVTIQYAVSVGTVWMVSVQRAIRRHAGA